MSRLPFSVQAPALVALALLLVLSGCRTYGGYGAEEALYNRIVEANRVFADELRRAESDLALLRNAAQQDERLAPFQDRYESMIQTHETFLVEHQARAEELSERSSHRQLNRTLGAIAADHRTMRQKYLRSMMSIAALDEERPRFSPRLFNKGMYSVSPVFYERVQSNIDRRITMRRALATLAEGADIELDDEVLNEEEPVMNDEDAQDEADPNA